jgi:hypothetical protein
LYEAFIENCENLRRFQILEELSTKLVHLLWKAIDAYWPWENCEERRSAFVALESLYRSSWMERYLITLSVDTRIRLLELFWSSLLSQITLRDPV